MAWWWTGWHVFPIKSLIEHIYKNIEYSWKIDKIVWFWEKNSLEQEIYLKLRENNKELYFQNIISGKYRRETWFRSRLKNIRDAFKFWYGIVQSIYYIKKHDIDVIFFKWWYVALPVVLAWKLLRKKILVHESDVRSWLVNKIAAKYANEVFTWFDKVLPKSTTIWQILSDDIVSTESIRNLPSARNLDIKWRQLSVSEQLYYSNPDKTYLLVMWWSQGSKRLYQNLLESINENKDMYKSYEIFIILWKENQNMKNEFDEHQNVHVFDFITQQEMGLLLKNCDISLTRAGTTSLAEQKLYDMKIIMVPIPRTHDQYDNAKFYVKRYDDILLDSKDENYKKNMLDIFKKYKNLKKKDTKKDILSEIAVAKDVIVKAILA